MQDVIIIGARCAGSATALLLARKGHRVLLVDKATFPSDTLSTHVLKSPGVARLKKWDLLDAVLQKTRCPPVHALTLDYSDFSFSGRIPEFEGVCADYCPRRIDLDLLLLEAAADAGAVVRQGFHVDELLWEGDQVRGVRGHSRAETSIVESAQVVVGADGYGSRMARAVNAACYEERPALACYYYSYWTGLPLEGGEIYPRHGCAIAAYPNQDGVSCVLVGHRASNFESFRADIEGKFLETVQLAPGLAERLAAAERIAPFAGVAGRSSYFRKPYGKGWALVGDAGLYQDPFTAQGMTDAFRDAELLSEALDAGLRREAEMTSALAEYENNRNRAARPMYDLACQLAAFRLPSARTKEFLQTLRHNPEQASRFVGVIEGTVPASEFSPADSNRKAAGSDASPRA